MNFRVQPSVIIFAVVLPHLCGTAVGQLDFDTEPINYSTTPAQDPIAKLQQQIDDGTAELDYDKETGYLKSVLQHLNVNPSSQVLISSKTSFQLRKISPQRPRAVYFGDESYVGWVQGGDVVELMATDPVQGQIFYALSQERSEQPHFIRDRGQCTVCHASSRTQGVPGGLVRSVYLDRNGQPHFGAGTFTVDHSSPFKDRWGGWYVTGTHGSLRHMGNVMSQDRANPEDIDREAGANVTDLSEFVATGPYLTPHSDIVALMVLEHQTQMQNYITRASYEARSAAHYDGVMSSALARPAGYISATTTRRIASAGDKLLRYMLFADEFQLTSPVQGTSGFATDFQSPGVRDSQGRSLRDFDLQTRLFKYPCSYLIYSPAFDRLPKPVKQYVSERLQEVLLGNDDSDDFVHLTIDDRKSILEILTETKPELWE
ncbi:MAG TPA: hypothetical protein EYG03_01970 [Planctomycetes bacterium]|nr:hypothetical protein [Fuerstiella sp.]HIK90746.1 hypothetical protein [Planctomycetota bacterium]